MPHEDSIRSGGDHFSRNDIFLREIEKIVESNLADEQFGVDKLARMMSMSRVNLYRKLHKLTGKNISQYIRERRMHVAMDLLKEDVANVAEIAYQVGFSSPAYFNKCFHDYYGFPPGEVIKLTATGNEIRSQQIRDHRRRFLIQRFIWYSTLVFLGMVIIIMAALFTIKSISRNQDEVGPKKISIAVLPFRNESADPENEYFCNGMMESILNHLVQVSDLEVISRTDVEPYRNTKKSRKEIARELDVENLLEGSVYKVGNRFRISVQLINPENGINIWSDSFEGEYTQEIFKVQSSIAKEVAYALKAVITPIEEQNIERVPTTDIAAYDYVLKGWEMINEYWQSLDKKYIQIAQNLLDRALDIDPVYIDAYELKCEIFWLQGKSDSITLYVEKIIELDPHRAKGYRTAGNAYQRIGKFDQSIESFEKALEIEPDNIRTNQALGRLYLSQRLDLKNGLPYLQRALELADNSSPDLIRYVGAAFSEIGYYEKAEEYISKAIELGDGCQSIQRKCECMFAQGKISQSMQFLDSICNISACRRPCNYYRFYLNMALKEYDRAEYHYHEIQENGIFGNNLWSFFPIDSILVAYMYKKLGKEDTSSAILLKYRHSIEKNININPWDGYKNNMNLAFIYAIQGEKEKALNYLSETLKYGPPFWIDKTPINLYFEDFQDDPQFQAYIRKGLKMKSALQVQFKKMEERGEIDL